MWNLFFLYLVEGNNVIDYASQNYMAFTDQLIGLGPWSNDGPKSHPRIFFEQKENLNLLVACALSLCIGNSEAVSPWNSLVQLWMENCISNLQSLKKGDKSNQLHPWSRLDVFVVSAWSSSWWLLVTLKRSSLGCSQNTSWTSDSHLLKPLWVTFDDSFTFWRFPFRLLAAGNIYGLQWRMYSR